MGHPKVMEGAVKALERLVLRFSTGIFSQASHPEYQIGRIRDAGITKVLPEDRIRITHRKTRETFLEALRYFGTPDAEKAVMIGNSFRSDINPALEAGAGAILVEPYEMWHYDNVPPVSQEFLRFSTFGQAAEYLLGDGTR